MCYALRVNADDFIIPGRGVLGTVRVDELDHEGEARTFEYTDRLGQPAEGFIMRWGGEFVAYENRCPHWSVPVGFDDENFVEGRDIVCPMHGARFSPETGICWSGPCIGEGLEKFEVSLDGEVATIRRRGLKLPLI